MPVSVLVVDDSAFMRKMISDVLNSDPEIRVVGTARDGQDAIEKVGKLQPDAITLDIEMPRVDGLTALAYIMNKHPTPVVMLSALTKKGAEETIKALEYGAVDFITKPSGNVSLDIEILRSEIIDKVKLAALAKVKKIKAAARKVVSEEVKFADRRRVVVIGASTGGPQALIEVLQKLPGKIPACLLIVQHMPKGFTKSFAERLDSLSDLEVKEAEDGDLLRSNTALVAPGDYHMVIENSAVKLNQRDKIHGVRPAVDVTMKSAAEAFEADAVGVLLTGMGSDGALGMRAIKERGGATIAQDESTSIIFGMPKAALELGCVDKVVPISQIPLEILRTLGS